MLCSCYLLQAQCWHCVKRVRQRYSGGHAYSHLYDLPNTARARLHTKPRVVAKQMACLHVLKQTLCFGEKKTLENAPVTAGS